MAEGSGQGQGVGQHRSQIAVGLEFEDLGADVGVQPGETGPGAGRQVPQHRLELVGIEAKLAVEVARADVLMGVTLDAGRKAQHQSRRPREARCQLSQQLQVPPVVRHHGDPVGHGQGQLLATLVVAVQHDPLAGHAPLESGQQFSGRDRIEAQSLGGHQGRDRQGAVGLGGI